MVILNTVLMEIKTNPDSMSTNQYWRKHEHKKVNQIWGDFLMSLFKLNMIGILVTEWNIFEKILIEIILLNPLKGGEILRKWVPWVTKL